MKEVCVYVLESLEQVNTVHNTHTHLWRRATVWGKRVAKSVLSHSFWLMKLQSVVSRHREQHIGVKIIISILLGQLPPSLSEIFWLLGLFCNNCKNFKFYTCINYTCVITHVYSMCLGTVIATYVVLLWLFCVWCITYVLYMYTNVIHQWVYFMPSVYKHYTSRCITHLLHGAGSWNRVVTVKFLFFLRSTCS